MSRIDADQIIRVAQVIKSQKSSGHGMDFYHEPDGKGGMAVRTDKYPEMDHPQVLDFFGLAVLQQHGFWYGDDLGYVEPMIGIIGEKKVKGSDLLWTVLKRKLDSDPEFFSPERLATVTPQELGDALADDAATPWPDFEERFKLTRAYGRWLVHTQQSPKSLVMYGNTHGLTLFLYRLGKGPYGSDKLDKKGLLLAMVLANRPEKFLTVTDQRQWKPIVDYHLMRVALRLGLVNLYDDGEAQSNRARVWVSEQREAIIREAVHVAVSGLIRESGLSMAEIDDVLWNARRYCPEMKPPDCGKCVFDSVCAKRIDLFQPVFRTTAY